tara:strand:- start:38 stop:508 length:471 start_codon:yes stop_codon:yes gene_type:complete
MAINRSNIKLQVTRGNKMKIKKRKAGGSFPDVTGDGETTMKDVLVKRGVLEKKGDKFVVAKKQNGGGLTDDIKKIKTRNKKRGDISKKASDMKAAPSTKASQKQYRGATRKPLADFKSKMKRRKDGGMVYQLYGGSTKNISNGNKFIQSFYDKGGK